MSLNAYYLTIFKHHIDETRCWGTSGHAVRTDNADAADQGHRITRACTKWLRAVHLDVVALADQAIAVLIYEVDRELYPHQGGD